MCNCCPPTIGHWSKWAICKPSVSSRTRNASCLYKARNSFSCGLPPTGPPPKLELPSIYLAVPFVCHIFVDTSSSILIRDNEVPSPSSVQSSHQSIISAVNYITPHWRVTLSLSSLKKTNCRFVYLPIYYNYLTPCFLIGIFISLSRSNVHTHPAFDVSPKLSSSHTSWASLILLPSTNLLLDDTWQCRRLAQLASPSGPHSPSTGPFLAAILNQDFTPSLLIYTHWPLFSDWPRLS